MKAAFASVLASTATAYFTNSIPVYGTYPGWIEGENKAGITLEVHYDLLCEDSKALDPVLTQLLATEWLGGTVREQIYIKYSLIPLPYHLHTWQVNQLIPYFMDNCMVDSTQCGLIDQYKDYSFNVQASVLAEDTISKDAFIQQWTLQVADELKVSQHDLLACYDRNTDVHGTEYKLRDMWKFATSNIVTGTPTTFLNGVKVSDTPYTVDGWMTLLNTTYESQWGASTQFTN